MHLSVVFLYTVDRLTCVCAFPLLSEQYQQSGQEHHPDHDACWHEADRREQTGQLCHSTTVPAASAARTGHTGGLIFYFFTLQKRVLSRNGKKLHFYNTGPVLQTEPP